MHPGVQWWESHGIVPQCFSTYVLPLWPPEWCLSTSFRPSVSSCICLSILLFSPSVFSVACKFVHRTPYQRLLWQRVHWVVQLLHHCLLLLGHRLVIWKGHLHDSWSLEGVLTWGCSLLAQQCIVPLSCWPSEGVDNTADSHGRSRPLLCVEILWEDASRSVAQWLLPGILCPRHCSFVLQNWGL